MAVAYGLLAVMGLVPVLNTMFGLVPIHGWECPAAPADRRRGNVFRVHASLGCDRSILRAGHCVSRTTPSRIARPTF
ncbi:MAG TPA: hypothetical protein VGR35_14000 [Tepidisphaeraceae bacterium]|nr:hypothetical protein [Tepidisphaeraceae bacterium]